MFQVAVSTQDIGTTTDNVTTETATQVVSSLTCEAQTQTDNLITETDTKTLNDKEQPEIR
jgi:hypothetical protein